MRLMSHQEMSSIFVGSADAEPYWFGLPPRARIWIAAGLRNLRPGFTALNAAVQTELEEYPFGGQVFVFKVKRDDLIKLHW